MGQIFRNFLWFIYNYFSITLLIKTLFDPWKRLKEEKVREFEIGEIFSRLAVNSLMRAVGMFARLAIIIFGLFSIILFFVLGFFAFTIWIFLPFIIAGMIAVGINYMASS